MKEEMYSIVIRPLVTEKGTYQSQTRNAYAFQVAPGANKTQIKLEEDEHGKIVLAVDEAVSNIMRHAYDKFSKGTRTIEILFSADAQKISLVLIDSGKEFDPTAIKDPDIFEHAKLGMRYGLGLFLMRRIMDEVKFVFRAGIENMLTMVKYFPACGEEPPSGGQEEKRDNISS